MVVEKGGEEMASVVISRSEQFVMYWWNGSSWTTHEEQAKRFPSAKAAQQEMRRLNIQYTVNYNHA